MDHECLNMAIRIAVCNQDMILKKQKISLHGPQICCKLK